MTTAFIATSIPLGMAVASIAARASFRKAEPCAACGSSKQLLASVLDRIPDLVLLLDAAGRIRYANTAARASYCLDTGDDLLSNEAIHPDDVVSARRSWSRLLEMPGKTLTEEVRVRRGESWTRLLVTAENRLGDAEVAAVLVIATDATRRRELEWQLQQAQRLEAVGRLAGGVAHDFNNFLTTIQGLTRIALDDGTLSPETRSDLTEVTKAADRASAVTRRLLAFSRRQVLRPRSMELNEQVRAAEKTIGRLIGEDISVSAFTAARDSNVFVDPAQLEQILLNLALNARDVMPQGGRLTLRTDDAVIGPEEASRYPYDVRAGEYVLLEVSDTGPGIAPHLREQVFEPFYTTKPTDYGSGLGLSTVYGIVKQSGGYVWIGDADGGGARISIFLPRFTSMAPTEEADEPALAPRRGATILVAEDDPTVRFLARRVLAREGYVVLEANDGTQALEMCAAYQGAIDLLLSDVVMPGLGGRELAERCKPIRPEMAVLFMSGYQEDTIVRSGLGGHDLLQKPFTPDALAERVRTALSMALPVG